MNQFGIQFQFKELEIISMITIGDLYATLPEKPTVVHAVALKYRKQQFDTQKWQYFTIKPKTGTGLQSFEHMFI